MVKFPGQTFLLVILSHHSFLGSQVNAKDSNGNTPLLLACSQHHLEVIKLLLKHKARVESQTELGATSLMFCAQAGIDEAVQRIIGEQNHLGQIIDCNSLKRLRELLMSSRPGSTTLALVI